MRHFLKNTLLILMASALLGSLAGGAYFLFFMKITEKRYNKVMCYYVARSVTRGRGNFDEKASAIRDFVHDNVRAINGYDNRLDTCAIEKLISGIGWCDQQARVFMQLARPAGITTRLLFLKRLSGSSPHSVAEALAPDGRWIIVDPSLKVDLLNKDGAFATQDDIREDLTIVTDNERIKARARFAPHWKDEDYFTMYANEPEYIVVKYGTKPDLLKFVPLRLIRPMAGVINERYLNQEVRKNIKSLYEFEMAKARTMHLLGYYAMAEELYDEVIDSSHSQLLREKAQFYKALLLDDEGRHRDAILYITRVLDSKDKKIGGYTRSLLGLRARLFKKTGNPGKGEKDLERAEFSMEI